MSSSDAAAPQRSQCLLNILGYDRCGYYNEAVRLANKHKVALDFVVKPVAYEASAWRSTELNRHKQELVEQHDILKAKNHRTSPMIYISCGEKYDFIGGYDDLEKWIDVKNSEKNKSADL